MSTKNTRLRMGYFIAAAIFLFNPNLNILDFLPDCIGYYFILCGLGDCDLLVPHFEESKRSFRYLIWLTLSRIPMYFVVSASTHGDSNLGVMFTLISLVYGILELLLVIPAFKSFFEGMEFLAERYGAFSLAGKNMERARSFTLLAAIAKPILAFLPELVFLTNQDPLIGSGYIDYVRFRPHLFVITFFVMLIFSILFLVFFCGYAGNAMGDKSVSDIFADLSAAHSAPIRGEQVAAGIHRAMFFFSLGAFCCIDITLDRLSYLPDALGALCFLLASLSLLSIGGMRAKVSAVLSGAWAVAASFSIYYRNSFFAKYSYESLGMSRGADALYNGYVFASGAESVLACSAFIATAILLAHIATHETGYTGDRVNQYNDRLTLHAALRRKCATFGVLGCLTAIFSFLEAFLGRITAKYEMGEATAPGLVPDVSGYSTQPVFGWLWIVSLALCLALFFYTRHLSEIYDEEVRRKYDLEE